MKRFSFRFQRLLELKQRKEDQRKAELGELLEASAAEGGASMLKVPSSAGQSSPRQPPHMRVFGSWLISTLWRRRSATRRARPV